MSTKKNLFFSDNLSSVCRCPIASTRNPIAPEYNSRELRTLVSALDCVPVVLCSLVMATGERSPSRRILETAKTLVVAYGQSACARQLNIPIGTICAWAHRYHWKRAASQSALNHSPLDSDLTQNQPLETQQHCKTPSEAVADSLKGHRTRSTIALAQWTARASEEAATASTALPLAKRVKDVASVHSILWPAETRTEIISFGILTGAQAVLDELPATDNVNAESTAPRLVVDLPSVEDRSALD